MKAPPLDFAADLVNTVQTDLHAVHLAGPFDDPTVAIAAMQVRATQAVAASLLAIADEMRLAREKGATGE